MPNIDGSIDSFDNVPKRSSYAVVKDTVETPPAYATVASASNDHGGKEMFKGFPGAKKSQGMGGPKGAKGKVSK
jgi:hypothetical protein